MSKALEKPMVRMRAYCLTCAPRRYHEIVTEPGTPMLREMNSWEYKHRGHNIQFSTPERLIPRDLDDSQFVAVGAAPWWLEFQPNANFQLAFVPATNMTFTSLNSLASDTSLLAGASALAIDNGSTGAPLEIGVSGYIVNNTGAAPTVNKEIDVYAYAALDDTPTYPDTLLGTDAIKTITTANILNSGLVLLASMNLAATTSQVNPFRPVGLTSLFGVMPRYWSIFVVHNSGQTIAASGNRVTAKGVYQVG